MDIVNWVYLKKAELIRENLSDPTDLVLLGADVTFEKRGDKYLSYAMTTADFADAIAGIIGAGSGTVSSIDVNGGIGISVSPAGPITTSGTFTVTNTAPDRVVVLNNGAGISVTGIYPNFTIAATGGGGGGTYTSDNGITENPANNFQLGGDTYTDSTFDNSRYIDTQLNAFYLKGQIASTLGPGGVITGILNITNDLGSGIAAGINVNVDQPGQTSGYGVNIKTGRAVGIKIASGTTCLDIDSSGTGLSKAARINSISTTAIEAGTQASSDSDPTIHALKYGTVKNDIQTVLLLTKSSNTGDGESGIGAAIKFSVATSTAGLTNTVGTIACAAPVVTQGAVSSFYRFSLRDAGTEAHVLIVNAKGLFELPLGLSNYANDAAAALGGIPINCLYRNGSVVQIRVT
jgi:hypothetical protein